MSISTLPTNILLEKWQHIGFFWQGEVTIAELPRLFTELNHAKQAENPTIKTLCKLTTTDGITRLSYSLNGTLWVDCHRCLSPIAIDVTGDYGTALLNDTHSETLAKLSEDEDFVLFEEIEMPDGRYLPIKNLLEDELLLALPTVIAHDDCDMPIKFPDSQPIKEEKENPFAVLADLKGKFS